MTKNHDIKIEAIDDKSPHLPAVIDLWSPNRSTLGLFPKDAFIERAVKRQILVAIEPEGKCIGYLLYRNSYDRITIVHLCIAPLHRKKGITKLLVDELKRITEQRYTGIGLSCRHDYGLQPMWANLGFVYQYDKIGKSKERKLLGYWWFDHGHTNLFSSIPVQKLESKLCVVIDRKIFSYLYTDEDGKNEAGKSLLSDWLQPGLELCITDEIFNYISLICDHQERRLQKKIANNFTRLPSHNQNLDQMQQKLQNIFLINKVSIDDIDLRHLARAIASDSHVFVTNEQPLLELSGELYDNFKLSVLSPSELISQLDELRNKPDYQPVRLAGTSLEQVLINRGQEDLLTNHFTCINKGETKPGFQQQLRRFIAENDKFDCYVILDKERQPLALFVYHKHKKHELELPLIRVGNHSLSATLARHLIFKAILYSTQNNRQFTRITDINLEETVRTAIQEDNFVRVDNGWLKVNLGVATNASQLSTYLTNLSTNLGEEFNFCLQIAGILKQEDLIKDVQASASVEKFLFPVKIIDAEIDNFIIPIEPRYAMDLFDGDLARQTLFGSKIELSFNREAVYYRSVINSRRLNAPCRIIWYVSQDKYHSYCGVSSLRACSFVDEVVIGKPKELYQRFQRLGVYKLDDIMNISPDKNGYIMAIRFSNTEPFKNIITLNKVQQILNNKQSFQSACKIEKHYFHQLYTLGIRNKA
ncbi:GNAT family N-acetyltransferase [Cylindrospermum sp. FACHB-282]|uniref:GNAT family N-acetyltransferase n=1 Tax=Cylindrospermum sp. FACHB-282 TaxID=2692794 RepID=UPI001686EF04|nr:GNAT family N-acetyltransferase [Cylindrospermum sp. FACHB-282]MBD2388834.1 GNAT family N-acetyltransferase [Cylindrospermum sp. FACHB-282]